MDEKTVKHLANQFDEILEQAIENQFLGREPWPMVYKIWGSEITIEISEEDFHVIKDAQKYYASE